MLKSPWVVSRSTKAAGVISQILAFFFSKPRKPAQKIQGNVFYLNFKPHAKKFRSPLILLFNCFKTNTIGKRKTSCCLLVMANV